MGGTGPGHREFRREFLPGCVRVSMDGDNLRDSSTSTLTLEAAFERLVKTLLTFFSNLAVSVNLQSRAFSNDLEILGWPKSSLAAHASSRGQTRRIIILCVFFFSLWVSIFLNRRSVISRLLGIFSGRQCSLQSLKREAPCELLLLLFFSFLSRRRILRR